MTRYLVALFAATCLSSVPAVAQTSTPKGASLEVHFKYTGSGPVDENHKVYLVLWDSPDFVKPNAGDRPLAVESLTTKAGTAKFQDVSKNPVYLSMAYDPTGKWAGDSAPPVGTSLGLYSKEPGMPAPIQLAEGKSVEISAELDDSYKNDKAANK